MIPDTVAPLFSRVLVKKLKNSSAIRNGVYLPSSLLQTLGRGLVIAASPEVRKHFKPGDTVLFPLGSSKNLIVDKGDEFIFFKHNEILGRVDSKNKQ